MKKLILLTLSVITTLSLSAQISINIAGDVTDISGTTLNIAIDPLQVNSSGDSYWTEHFIVTNNTGTDGQWTITRKVVSEPANWSDQVCWPPTCYVPNSDLYTTPNTGGNPAPTILNSTSTAQVPGYPDFIAEIKPQVYPDFNGNGSAVYTYYVTDAASGVYLDSVTVSLSYTVGIEENKSATTLSISPNPANEFVAIAIEGTQNANVKIVDVLGNIVYSKLVNTSTKIGVSDLRNGVYFVTIEGNNNKSITKKLIVKH